MSEGFPLLTSKKMFLKGVIHELIWFLKGDTNIKYLLDNNVHIWDGDCYANYLKKFTPPTCPPELDVQPDYYAPMSKDWFVKSMQEKNERGEEFVKKWGELGPIYGKQWRDWGGHKELHEVGGYHYGGSFGGSFGGADHKVGGKMEEFYIKGIDQIQNLINDLKTNPDSRRLIVNAWNVGEIDQMTLPPCHFGFQCYTFEISEEERYTLARSKGLCPKYRIGEEECSQQEHFDKYNVPKRYLTLKWFQRSVDTALGLPLNIASYGLLLHLLAKEVNMIPYELIFNGGDCHIYLNQVEGVKTQLTQETYTLPKLILNNNSFDDIKYEDIQIIDYKSSPTIKLVTQYY